MSKQRLLIVGAGFSGAVLARELAEAGERVLVIDARPHLAGNCHTARDERSGVMEHRYGPHIFHTPRHEIWDYLGRFTELHPYTHRVKATLPRGIFSLPINLLTINQFFGKSFTPREAEAFIHSLGETHIGEPANLEEQALKMVGRELYEAFFYGYTKKQWGCEPRELPAAILQRLPVRFNDDDSYYSDRWQGIPREGYTEAVRRILAHEAIEVRVDTPWHSAMQAEFAHVFYTGALDAYFGYDAGRLRYRTVYWEKIEAVGDYQGTAQMNYPSLSVPQTRICEHKHFATWETHERTTAWIEFSKATAATDDPFYPLRLASDLELFRTYAARAAAAPGISFLGRLATYRYMDMHQVIGEALDFSKSWLRARAAQESLPVFPAGV
jgi:UDP-galactopyranose mutase